MSTDKSWQNALSAAGLRNIDPKDVGVSTGSLGRTPREGIEILTRREQIGRSRRRHRRAGRTRDRLLAVAIVVGGWLTSAWALMIPVGIAHHDWWHRLPPMSFGTAAAITFWPFALVTAVTLLRAYLGMD